MSALGSLVVKLALEYAEYTRGLSKSDQESLKFAQNAQRHFDMASASSKEFFVGVAKGAVTVAAGYLGISSAISSLTRSIDDLATLDDMSQKTGAAVENLSRLQKVAIATGADFNNVDSAISKLAKGMATFDDESNKTNKALATLGLSSKDAAGKLRDPSQVIVDVARKLQGYEDGAAKAALMNDLFGKSGADLLPYLNDVAEKIDQFSGVSTEAAQRASELQDKMGLMRVRADELWTKVASDLVPAFTDVIDVFSRARTESEKTAQSGGLNSWAEDLVLTFTALANTVDNAVSGIRLAGAATAKIAASRTINKEFDAEKDKIAPGTFGFRMVKAGSDEARKLDEIEARRVAAQKTVEEEYEKHHANILSGVNRFNRAYEDLLKARATKAAAGNAPQEKKATLDYESGNGKGKGAKEQISDYEKLTRAINDKIAAQQLEMTTGQRLTESQKLLIDLQEGLRTGAFKMKSELAALYQARIQDLAVGEEVIASTKRANAAKAEMEKLLKSHNDEVQRSIENAVKEAEQNERLNETFGMTKEQIEALELARLEEQLAQKSSVGMTLDEIEGLEKLIEAKKRSAAALSSVEAKDASKTAAEEAARAWEKTAGDIERSLTDALMRGFEGGKGAGLNFLDTIKNLFKTQAIKIGVETIMSGGSSTLRGLLGGTINGGGTTAMGGTGLQGIQSAFSGALDSWGAKIGFADVGRDFVGPLQPGQSAGMTASGALGAIGAGAGVGGMVGGAVGRATGSKTMGAASGALSGAMMGASVGGPWGAAIGAVAGGIMGYMGSGGEKKGRNTAWADVSSNNIVAVKNGDGSDGSNLAAARKIAEQYAQYANVLEAVGGFDEIGKARFGIGSTKSDFFTIGGQQFTHSAHDKEGMMLRAVKEGVKNAEAMDSYVRKALLAMNSADDLGNMNQIIEFAKNYRYTLAQMQSAADPLAAQRATLRKDAFSAADARRAEFAQTTQQARESGFDTTTLRNAMRQQAMADMGLTTASKPLEGAALEMLKVKENANAMRSVLDELGYSVQAQTDLINKSIKKGQDTLRKDFITGITDRILELTDASKYAEQQLKKEQDARLADAKALGLTTAQIKEVTRLNDLERTAKVRAQADNLSGWLRGQKLSDLSSLSPEAKFAEAQKQFASLMGSARKGDSDALGRVTGAADVLLAAGRDQYASGARYTALESMVRSQVSNLGVALKLPGFDPAAQAAEQKRQTEELKKQTAELKALIVQSGTSGAAMLTKLAAIEKRLASIESDGSLAKAA